MGEVGRLTGDGPGRAPYPWHMASITLDIKSELPKAIRWTDAMTKQLPFAIAKAMTESAKKAQVALKAQTPRYVDRPTPWTMNSTFVRFASPKKLEAWVGFKDFASKGTAAAKYLQPMISGGARRQKSSERQLVASGVLPSGSFIVPTGVTPLKLNRYGNLSGGTYTQVLSRLKALGEQGYTANVSGSKRSQGKRSQRDYFAGRPGTLPLGIYARLGKKPKGTGGPGSLKGGRPITSNLPRGFHTVFYVTRQPLYMSKFPVPKILDNTYRNTFGPNLRSALERELAYQARKA